VTNILTTIKLPGAVKGEIARQEQWEELRSVFPIYLALARHLEFEIPFGPDRRNLPVRADAEISAGLQRLAASQAQSGAA